MKLYINELAPWERKQEYFHTVQLGKDLKSQTQILNKAIDNQSRVQLVSANAIIASQDRISEGISQLTQNLYAVEQGIEGLKSAFEWGISDVIWQLEQNRDELRNILEVLMAPLDTQAKERRRRAENAYANGWIDDAEEEFLEAEKLNRYDFAIHISLGMIYLLHKVDKKKALEYFEKAVKYARPESNYYTSYALLHKSLIKRDMNSIEEALSCSEEATELLPEFWEAKYQYALLNAMLGNAEKAIHLIREIILKDVGYVLKIECEPLFDKIRAKIHTLYKQLTIEKKNKIINFGVNEQFASIKSVKQKALSIVPFSKSFSKPFEIESTLDNSITKVNNLVLRNSLLDIFEAEVMLDKTFSLINEYSNSVKTGIQESIREIRNVRKAKIYEIDKKKNNFKMFNILSWFFDSEAPIANFLGMILYTWFFGFIIGKVLEKQFGVINGVEMGIFVIIFFIAGLSFFSFTNQNIQETKKVKLNEKYEKLSDSLKELSTQLDL